jgi:hypothetical protein
MRPYIAKCIDFLGICSNVNDYAIHSVVNKPTVYFEAYETKKKPFVCSVWHLFPIYFIFYLAAPLKKAHQTANKSHQKQERDTFE